MKLKDRIIKNTKEVNGCWEWQLSTKGFGYGYMTVGSRSDGTRRTETAHRASYSAFVGEIPEGMWVLHKCDNPKCCNPDHLYIGGRKRNVKDMVERGRLNHFFGESSPMSKLTNDEVINIRLDRINKRMSYRAIADKYNLKSHKSVIQICKGELWSHIPLPTPPKGE